MRWAACQMKAYLHGIIDLQPGARFIGHYLARLQFKPCLAMLGQQQGYTMVLESLSGPDRRRMP